MDQPSLQSRRCGLRPVGDPEFAEDVIDVTLDRCFADFQSDANLLIALTSHNQLEHFHFPGSQLGVGYSLGKPFGYGGGDAARSRIHTPDRGLQFLKEHILEQVSFGPCLQRAVDIFGANNS